MKRIMLLLLLVLCALGALACGKKEAAPVDQSPLEIAQSIFASQENPPEVSWLTPQDDSFAGYLRDFYNLDESLWVDGALCYPSGAQAEEIAVLQMKDSATANEAQYHLADYIQSRISAFQGYAPEEVALLEQAGTLVQGQYLALFICQDMPAAQDAFAAVFGEDCSAEIPPVVEGSPEIRARYDDRGYVIFDPPNKADMTIFQNIPIVAAWKTGDSSTLSTQEWEIYQICKSAIEETITPDMSDYQKELAIHDWMIDWADYDESALSAQGSSTPSNSTPYGFLVNRKAVCMGYANTFQLFMDLLDIECLTVIGASYYNSQDHAWNMVKLENKWYCVDATWNDPIGDPGNVPSPRTADLVKHRYFNLTSEEMRYSRQWDYDTVPETVATKYKWAPQ